jgi:hypothetical protein
MWECNSHSQKWENGVLRDSRKLRARFEGSNILSFECSWSHWKGLEMYMSKMASHEPFRHLQLKLWAKEGPGVKLLVWLPTTKSQESTSFWRRLKECNMALESSWRELQLWFRPRPDPSLGRGAMSVQSLGTPTRNSFGTPTWESREKEPFGCSLDGELQSILYGGRWWLPPSSGRGESNESKVAHGLSQHWKCA